MPFYQLLPFFLFLFLVLLRFSVFFLTKHQIYTPKTVPSAQFGIVFGAGLNQFSYPTRVLNARLETAAFLFHTGKINKIIVTGDNRDLYYNEPEAMQKMLISMGIEKKHIILDTDGFNSFRSIVNIATSIEKSNAILITQLFHLPRALWIAKKLNLITVGATAMPKKYFLHDIIGWHIRETGATVKMFWSLWRYRKGRRNTLSKTEPS